MNWAFTALVNGLIASAMLSLAVWVLLHFAARRGWNAATRYVVWWMTLIAAIAAPLLYLPIFDRPVVARPALTPIHADVIENPQPVQITVPETGASVHSAVTLAQPEEKSSASKIFPIQVTPVPWTGWIFAAWGLTGVLLLLRLLFSYVLLERRKQRASIAPLYQARVEEWLTRCQAGKRQVKVRLSSEIVAPMAAGPYRPSILVPTRIVDELDDNDLNQIGLHEAAHFGRRDDYMLVLQRIIEALFVFHPVVRWITRRIDLEREIACDDFVIQITGRPRPYAACLTRIMELTGGVLTPPLAASATERRSQLDTRVEMLLDDARRTTTRVLKPRLTVAMASLFVMIVVAFQAPGPVYFAAQTTTTPSLTPAFTRTAASTPIPRAVVPEPTAVRPKGPPVRPAPRQVQPAAAAVAAQEPPIVRVPVAVTEPRGRFITGLEKDHFKVFEDDVEQSVADLTSDSGLSVAVVYAIQNGAEGSGVLRQAISQLMSASDPVDEFWTVEDDRSRLESSNTTPPILAKVIAAAERLKIGAKLAPGDPYYFRWQ